MESNNQTIMDAYYKCRGYLTDHHNILFSYSGGSDSDTMLDLFQKALQDKLYKPLYPEDQKIHYVFFDTGIEYDATKRHIKDIENKYNINIEVVKAYKPVPLGVKEFGVPFLSKYASQMISRLQDHNFDFKLDGGGSYEYLLKKYPKAKSALGFWTNKYGDNCIRKKSHFNIDQFFGLKEFIIQNPPDFKISDMCCFGAKKYTAKSYIKENNIDLQILGLRSAEGGVRSTNIKSCFDKKGGNYKVDTYRPIWWFNNEDKQQYKKENNLIFSDCYEKYGMTRTGCSCCPFGSKFEDELEQIKILEPNLYNAVNNIFGKSYEYTRKYREFKQQLKQQNKQLNGQIIMNFETL